MTNQQTHQRVTTLIELSVVIAVLLLLVGVLFIGITAWKSGANKAACVINLSSIQKAVRGYQNMNQLTTGGTLAVATLTSAGFWQSAPVCLAGGTYSPLGSVPSQGIAYMNLQRFRSRTFGNDFGQLVSLESALPKRVTTHRLPIPLKKAPIHPNDKV
jgi:type II secretory pathway pseudopilin PulG